MEKQIHRIGVLTSGGDAPGMNAAVRAVVRAALGRGIECVGIRRGWNGLIAGDFVQLDASSVSHIIDKGGTMLYTARSEEFMTAAGRDKALATCRLLGLEGIVAIGGDGTFRGALALSRQAADDRIGSAGGGHPRHHRQRHRLLPLHHRLRHRLQHRHRVHRQAAGHHAVPRALLRGGGHGPPCRASGPVCGHLRGRHRRADPRAAGGL